MIWCLAAVAAILAIDWLIVMGIKPKEWKGGGKRGEYQKRGPD